jgi:hypothetical protein
MECVRQDVSQLEERIDAKEERKAHATRTDAEALIHQVYASLFSYARRLPSKPTPGTGTGPLRSPPPSSNEASLSCVGWGGPLPRPSFFSSPHRLYHSPPPPNYGDLASARLEAVPPHRHRADTIRVPARPSGLFSQARNERSARGIKPRSHVQPESHGRFLPAPDSLSSRMRG